MLTTVTEIKIFPVKSLHGISLPRSAVTTRGLAHDRRFMLIDSDHTFLTQREQPLLASIDTAIHGGALTFTSALGDSVSVPLTPPLRPTRTVTVWSSHVHAHTVSAEADEFFSEQLGVDARLVYMPDTSERRVNPGFAKNCEIVSFADGYPLLIASEESLADLNARIVASGGKPVTMDRFRANVVVAGCAAFAEETWREFSIGSTGFRGAKPCTRCQVTTTDQRSGEVLGPEPLRTLATYRDSPSGVRFGMNLLVTRVGELGVGDALVL